LTTKKEALKNVIERYGTHPIWTHDETHSIKVTNFYNALQKNQGLNAIGESMKLTLAYLLNVEVLNGSELDD